MDQSRRAVVAERPIATPLPLGFLGLFVATTAFATLQLHWIPSREGAFVAWGVLGLTVPAQLLACVFGFLARDPVAGTGMGVLAGTWAGLAVATLLLPPGSTSQGEGVLLVAASVAMLVPVSAAGSKLVAALVMGTVGIRFAVTGVAELTGSAGWLTAAGWTGLVLAALAVYGALAFELEGVRSRPVLPVLRRGSSVDVSEEPGVRSQL